MIPPPGQYWVRRKALGDRDMTITLESGNPIHAPLYDHYARTMLAAMTVLQLSSANCQL